MNRNSVACVVAVLACAASLVAARRAEPVGLPELCWAAIEADFTSGRAGAVRYPIACRDVPRLRLPQVQVLGCSACVGAVWRVGDERAEASDVVWTDDAVSLEVRYSGERRTGDLKYGLEFSDGAASCRIPLDVHVRGFWQLRPPRQPASVVVGRTSMAWIDLDSSEFPVIRGDGLEEASDWTACADGAVEEGERASGGRRISLCRASGWKELNHAVIEFGAPAAPDSDLPVQMIGLPALDVATVPGGSGTGPGLVIRSRLTSPLILRIASEKGDSVAAHGVYLSGRTSIEERLGKPASGSVAVVRVEAPAIGFRRLVPLKS